MTPICPKCFTALEKLQACGASNYFCNECNDLISKKNITEQTSLYQSLSTSSQLSMEDFISHLKEKYS